MPLEMVLDIISHLNTPTDYPTKLVLAQTNRAFMTMVNIQEPVTYAEKAIVLQVREDWAEYVSPPLPGRVVF